MDKQTEIVINELEKLLKGGSAHAGLDGALKGLPAELRGTKVDNLPYTIWQLVEHIRIAQWDMLQFSKDADHKSPKWPDDYWPKESGPKDEAAWDSAIKQINDDFDEFIALLKKEDIYTKIPHGSGQSI